MAHALFAGYFGCGNLGDDALLLGFLAGLEAAGIHDDYRVLSQSPELLMRRYNLRGVDRKDRKATQEAILTCDAVVFAGGSVFQDVTSLRSVAYYHDIVKRAKKAGKPVLMLGQGVGPLNRFLGKRMAADAFNSSAAIVVRDPASKTTLQGLGVKAHIQVAADPAFLLPPPRLDDTAQNFGVGGMRSIGVAVRPAGDAKKLAGQFAELCKLMRAQGLSPVLIEMDEKIDGPFIDEIEKQAGARLSHIKKAGSPTTIMQRMARMDGVIAMRLHAAILATVIGLPPFMIGYDPKSDALAKLLDLPHPTKAEDIVPEKLLADFLKHQAKIEPLKKLVEKRRVELAKLAKLNVDVYVRTLHPTATL